MTNPITPPPELVEQWLREWNTLGVRHANPVKSTSYVAIEAAQWGADQELEACKQYMHDQDWFMSPTLRMAELHNARRPKPPSLKEQALLAIDTAVADDRLSADVASVVRRALEALYD
jgi:hypothetical protein